MSLPTEKKTRKLCSRNTLQEIQGIPYYVKYIDRKSTILISSYFSRQDFVCFVLFEFWSFRLVRNIAGPGWVIGPSQGQKKGGEPPEEN